MEKELNLILLLLLYWLPHSILASIQYRLVGITNSGKPCLNTCENGRCAVDYHLNTEECVVDQIAGVPTYYRSTSSNYVETCSSNCAKFGSAYEWCFTKENFEWDYCSSKVRSPSNVYGYDIYGYPCITRCDTTYGQKYYECLLSTGTSSTCASPAILPVHSCLNIFSNGRSKRGALDKIFSQTVCSNVCRTRVRDGTDGHTQDLINSIYSSGMNVENVTNPSAPFTFVATTNSTNTNGDTVYLPLIIQANIRQISIPVQRQSSDITGPARRNVNNMYNGMAQGIDVGHIVGFQNGGTTDLFNYVGQTAALNRGAYKVIENEINSWINFDGGTAELTVVVVYSGTIPEEFAIKLKLYNGDGSLHSDCLDMILKNI